MATMYPSMKTGFTSTRLWTNASPNSKFAAQTVTLSQDMDNFDYLEIVAKHWYDSSNESAIGYIFPVDDAKTCTSGKNRMNMGLVSCGSSLYSARHVRYVSDTQIRFETCYKVNKNSNDNNGNIPLYINGLKL